MKPILFNTEMVQAILDGRKTQTRRVIKQKMYQTTSKDLERVAIDAPYKKGDILYVRETFCVNMDNSITYKATHEFQEQPWKPSIHMPKEYARIFLKVTDVRVERLQDITYDECLAEGVVFREIPHAPPTYIYKNYNMDENDTRCSVYCLGNQRESFSTLWNSTSKDGYKWEDNPYVFVYEFKRVDNV